jgi:hypothetical protein
MTLALKRTAPMAAAFLIVLDMVFDEEQKILR